MNDRRPTGDMVAAHMGDLFEQPGQRAAKGPSRCRIPFGPLGPTGGVAAGVLVSLVVRFACVG